MPSSSQQKSMIAIIFRVIIYISFLKVSKAIEPIPNFDLSSTLLDPTKTGFTIIANTLSGYGFGHSVDVAGDINGDGLNDIIVGAYGENSNTGAVYVIYGGSTSLFLDIDTSSLALDPATTGFKMTGGAVSDYFGELVSRAGDINNDGFDDIIVGAPGENDRGAVYVIYGAPKSSLSNLDLSSTPLDPATTGFMIAGEYYGDHFGWAVNPAGDINNDGYDDIIIGAIINHDGAKGAAYIIYGGPKSSFSNIDLSLTTLNPTSTGFVITGNFAGDLLGRWVNTAGDIDKDGFDDIIIGAPGYNGNKGASYVIYGAQKSSLSNLDLSSISLDPSITGFIITGENTNDMLGNSVSTAGDINDDGYDDIMIGANTKNSNKGAVYVIYGGPKSSLLNIDLSSTTLSPTTTGFTIKGSDNDLLGWPVASGGDINGDGYGDMIIGAYGHDSERGTVYVLYGGPKSSLSDIDLSSTVLDPRTTGFSLKGNSLGDRFGFSANAGDINNDGYDDIIIGAYAKNGGSGIAYVVHSTCPTFQCDQCVSRICQACKTPYLLYQSWCLLTCPTRAFSFNGLCKDCPIHCSSCISQESCQTCDEGYILSNSLCVLPPAPSPISSPSYPKIEAAATQAISSGVRGISSVVNVGSATSPMTALVSKIVQNTRYLNLSVTDELTSIYQTWQTDLISWPFPNAITRLDHFKTSPEVFARNGLGSSFLENFWSTLMTITSSLAILIIFLGLKSFLDGAKYDNWLSTLAKKLIAGFFSFALIQAYGCFDDILFYLVLDLKTNPFNTFFSWISLVCAFGFLALGCFLVFLNVWKVRQYQRIKASIIEIDAFNERNKKWELFYSDFNDTDIWSQSCLALLIVRSSLSSLIIATLYEYPLMQTSFLVILDGAIILFLHFIDPFATLRGKLAQSYFEAITLLVHLCTFILALQDTFQNPSEIVRNILSTSLIYLNTALITGSITFLGIEIYKTISEKRREAKRKQLENITVREETQDTQRILPRAQPINRIHPEAEIDSRRKPKSIKNVQVLPRGNSNFLPGFTRNIHGMNLQPSNDYNLSMNTEDSILPDMDSSLRINNTQRPHIRNHFQPQKIRQQRNLSLARNPKRQIRNLAQINPIDFSHKIKYEND